MISGSELPPGKFATQFARAYTGEKIATVSGSNVLCGPIEAALANGMLVTPVLGAATSAKLIEKVFDLENVKSVREFRPLLQRG